MPVDRERLPDPAISRAITFAIAAAKFRALASSALEELRPAFLLQAELAREAGRIALGEVKRASD